MAQFYDRGILFSMSQNNYLLYKPATIGATTNYDLTDPDHSRFYSFNVNTTISFGSFSSPIGYVAISGHNLFTDYSAFPSFIEIYDDTTLVGTYVLESNGNLFLEFFPKTFTDLKIAVTTDYIGVEFFISYVSAGTVVPILYGAPSGYNYLSQVPNMKGKSSLNSMSAPTSYLKENAQQRGSLKIPNINQFDMLGFRDVMETSQYCPFFIKEVYSRDDSAILCYDPTFKVTANPNTPSLWDFSANFKAYRGTSYQSTFFDF